MRRRWHRAQRHYAHQLLTAVVGRVDEQARALAEQRTVWARRGDRRRRWPDIPLGLHVRRALHRRARIGKPRGR